MYLAKKKTIVFKNKNKKVENISPTILFFYFHLYFEKRKTHAHNQVYNRYKSYINRKINAL